MRLPFFTAMLGAAFIVSSHLAAWAEDAPETDGTEVIDGLPPVMVAMPDGEAPSSEEWNSLHSEPQRASLFGSLGDFKSQTVAFMNTKYLTANRAEGTLASFGKADEKKGFDRYGHISGVEFNAPANSWKQRYALNAAALVKLTGKARFQEFAGVELSTAVSDRRQIEVTFVGTMVPKDEAVRRLNGDVEALEYLLAIQNRRMQYKKKFSLLGSSTPPPAPKVVLANVIMLDGRSSQAFDRNVGGKAASVIHCIGGELKLGQEGSETVSLLTPVVRCYRTYSIEFKTDVDGKLELVSRNGSDGQPHQVPVVFDLTPDL